MTQVPPTRYSSATITRAPWPAAMRAARTPPDPAPITRKSTSWAAISAPARKAASQVVALLLHFLAEARRHLLVDLARPHFGARQALVDDGRLLGGKFLADRRLVEGEHVPDFSFAELLGIKP